MKLCLALLGLMAIGNIPTGLHVVLLAASDPQHTCSNVSRQSSSGAPQGVLEPPQFLIDLYSGTIENVGSKLEGASRVVAVTLHKGVKRGNNKFFLSFKRPDIYRVRSVKLALTKLTHSSIVTRYSARDNSSAMVNEPALGIFQKKKTAGKRNCVRPIFKSRKYDIFNVQEFYTNELENSKSNVMLEFNIAFHCCGGESPSWVGDVYQLDSKRAHSPLLLFYDDISTRIWNNSVIQETMSEHDHFFRNDRSIRSAGRVYQPPCKLRPWTVKVKDLGWSKYVYAPSSLQINHCSGECRFLGNAKSTHHALIKYLFLSKRAKSQRNKGISRKIKWACCAPNHFQSINVIYQDTDGSIVFDEWDNVRAVSCGCH